MNTQVATARDGARGFDTDTKLNAALCGKLAASGLVFAVRYVGRAAPNPSDLTTAEVDAILGAGLALMVVQHVRRGPWMPSAALGASDGQAAASNAGLAGVPAGVCVFCDLEGIAHGATQQTIDYANAWTAAVSQAGYDPGVYIGFDVPLSGDQLFHDLSVKRYWRSLSNVPDVAVRGYQMVQHPESVVAGVRVDIDVIQRDRLGSLPEWLMTAPTAVPVA